MLLHSTPFACCTALGCDVLAASAAKALHACHASRYCSSATQICLCFLLQAYGAEHYPMLGLTLQRGLLICGTFIIIGLPFWLHIKPLLILCGAPD